MNLFPMFAAPAASQRADLPLYTDVAMDYDAMEPRWESGEPVIVTGLEAVKSWAVRAILTARIPLAHLRLVLRLRAGGPGGPAVSG